MKSIDDFNIENTDNLLNESVDNVNQTPVKKSEDTITEYAEREVKILFYSKESKMIVFDFDDAKIQMPFDGKLDMSKSTLSIKYKGTVGTSDFEIKIK